MADTVLLTGASGFLGGHVALALLGAGYQVRGSVRDLAKADQVRAALAKAGADTTRLEFVALDLLKDEGWEEAARGARFLVHTASPFVLEMPKDKMDLIRPAVEGTERALNAGLKANVDRIVLTSSMAAIAYGHNRGPIANFTAADWTVLEGRGVNAYTESKTRAERRAWAMMKAAGRETDLVSINPSGIYGPLLDDDPGTSVGLILRLLKGGMPAAPRFIFAIIDVRDVADAHVAALTSPSAGGRRIPMGEGATSIMEVANIIRRRFPERARKLPRFQLPDWAVRLVGLVDPQVRDNLGELGNTRRLDSSPAVALLGRDLIAPEAAVVASTESLIAKGLV
jgi:nucleoside-diphosphate-sugar epimerase